MRPHWIKYLYYGVLLILVIGRILNWSDTDQYLKPLLMPVLLYYLIEKTAGEIYKTHLFIASALIFSWIGDLLLLGEGVSYFYSGALTFLVVHGIYFAIFRKRNASTFKDSILQKKWISGLLLIFLLAGFTGIFTFVNYPLNLLLSVYACVIYLAVSSAFFQKKVDGYGLMTLGISIFLLSDSVLFVREFIYKFSLSEVIVILTYGIAQFLIVEGVIKSEKVINGEK